MKFSLSLKYNSVPEWQDKYINYSHLKKIVYELQSTQLNGLKSDDDNEEDLQESSSKFNKISKIFKKKQPTEDETTYELQDIQSISKADKLKIKLGLKHNEETKEIEVFDPKNIFLQKLELELAKIDEFYKSTESELYIDYDHLINNVEFNKIHIDMHDNSDAHSILSHKSSVNEAYMKSVMAFNLDVDLERGLGENDINYTNTLPKDKDDDDDEEEDLHSENSALLSHEDINIKSQKVITLKKRTVQLFLELSQLKSYIELNRMGFMKITKKFDKSLQSDLKSTLFDTNEFFHSSHTFNYHTLIHLDSKLNNLVEVYASLTGRIDRLDECKDELKSQLREHIVWERNTVWKDMIGLETQTQGDVKVVPDVHALTNDKLYHLEFYQWKLPFDINLYFTKLQYFKLPTFLNTPRTYKLVIIIAVTAILLGVKTFNDQAEHRCMALLACVALLWATEAIPLFVTALLCPLLIVLFKVCKNSDGSVMSASTASSYVLSQMWSSTIMVLLGGFTLAAALSKYNIAKVLASYILSIAGTKPRNILFSIMCVSLFLSMWI